MSKYHNIKTERDGFLFDSRAEARRYDELKLLEANGYIKDLVLHPSWKMIVNGFTIGRYTADFKYNDNEKQGEVVEDVKGRHATKTEAYGLRKRLMKALFNIDIVEVGA